MTILPFSICTFGSLLFVTQYYVMWFAKTVLVTFFAH